MPESQLLQNSLRNTFHALCGPWKVHVLQQADFVQQNLEGVAAKEPRCFRWTKLYEENNSVGFFLKYVELL